MRSLKFCYFYTDSFVHVHSNVFLQYNYEKMLIVLKLLGSIALLIYGMKVMSEALQKLAGPQLRHLLGAMTTNRFSGVATGALVTVAVQSSAATTVMTVSFVNAALLTLSQAISVIMGANIGTTMSAWIMSAGFSFNVANLVWPKQKTLPHDMDYTLDYEVFIPEHSENEDQAVRILEEEALKLAFGTRIKTKAGEERSQMRIGTIKHNDSHYGGYVPMENLKIRFQLGSYIAETYTNSDGTFYASPQLIDDAATWSVVLQHAYWKITSKSSTTPYVSSMGTVGDTWATSNEIFRGLYSSLGYFAVHPAVNFYYHGDHQILTASYESGIRIRVSPDNDPDAWADFTYSIFSAAYITVYQNTMDTHNYLNGAILHELGHFTQYRAKGTILNYSTTNNLIRESYAEYVGNYLCDRYYTLLGWSNPNSHTNYTGCAAQFWTKTGDNVYSPLFVDLFDNYNQSSISSIYNNDSINGFSHGIVRQISANCKTWSDVKNVLDDYVGVYYTQGQYNEYVAPYEYWFSNN